MFMLSMIERVSPLASPRLTKNILMANFRKAISSYIGFFAILWFTWLQVVLYDVRFGVDSLFERICKLLHFGVMVSYAVVGTNFDPSNIAEHYVTFRQLSLILVISRIVLIIQYGSVLFWIKGHKKVITPILIQMATFAIGAIISLGLLFTFKSKTFGRPYIGWYAIAALEAIVVFLSSSQWRVVSFKRTNLNERCGLLTLIILGEGIIVLTKAMNSVVKGENFSSAIIAQIISAVLIIVIYPSPPSPSLVLLFLPRISLLSYLVIGTTVLPLHALLRPSRQQTLRHHPPTILGTSPFPLPHLPRPSHGRNSTLHNMAKCH